MKKKSIAKNISSIFITEAYYLMYKYMLCGVKLLVLLVLMSSVSECDLFAKEKTDKQTSISKTLKNKDDKSKGVKKSYKKTPVPAKEKDTGKKKDKPGSKDKSTEKAKEKDKKESEKEKENEKKKAEWIEKTINFDVHRERKRAIGYILTIKDETLKKKLEKKLVTLIKEEINAEVKIKSITVAGELKLKDAVSALTDCLNDISNDIKVPAVYAIKRIGDHSTKPILIEKLKKEDFEKNSIYTEALIDTLGVFKTTELLKFAIDTIKDDKTTSNNRELFIIFLGKIDSKESKDTLIELLKNEEENTNIRSLAANSLAKLGIKESASVIDDVIQQIESYSFKKKKKFYKMYMYCIAALAKLGDEKAIPRLIDSLRSDNTTVRLRAVKLIKELNDKRTIDILRHKMDYDSSMKVRAVAKKALKELGVDVEKEKEESDKKKESKKSKTVELKKSGKEKKAQVKKSRQEKKAPAKKIRKTPAKDIKKDKKTPPKKSSKIKKNIQSDWEKQLRMLNNSTSLLPENMNRQKEQKQYNKNQDHK